MRRTGFGVRRACVGIAGTAYVIWQSEVVRLEAQAVLPGQAKSEVGTGVGTP
jgi:hypothetical protein